MKPPSWLHRLWCAAFAFRSANAVLTMPSGNMMLCAHCKTCGWTRVAEVIGDQGVYKAGHFFWPTDR